MFFLTFSIDFLYSISFIFAFCYFFFLLILHLICSSFSRLLRYLSISIWDLVSNTCIRCYKFPSKYFFCCISHFKKVVFSWLVQKMSKFLMKLLWPKCHLEVCCLLSKCFGILQLYLLLISSFIPLWSESILILLNLLRCLWSGMWFILVNVPHELDNVYSAAVGGSVLWISYPVDWWYCWVQLCPDLMPAEWQLLIEGYWTLIVDSSISFSSSVFASHILLLCLVHTQKRRIFSENLPFYHYAKPFYP